MTGTVFQTFLRKINKTKLVRYRFNGDTLQTPQVLLEEIPGNTYHNGSRMTTSPEGHLFLSTGDAGDEKNTQNVNVLSGKVLYQNNCSSCHRQTGQGMEGRYPPLKDSGWVKSQATLLQVIVNGLDGPITIKGEEYDGEMPSFAFLSDRQIAKIATYVYREFGGQSGSIGVEQVKNMR